MPRLSTSIQRSGGGSISRSISSLLADLRLVGQVEALVGLLAPSLESPPAPAAERRRAGPLAGDPQDRGHGQDHEADPPRVLLMAILR